MITAATAGEARREHDAYRRLEDPEGTLALWSGWLGFDPAPYGLGDPLTVAPNDAIRSLSETFGDRAWKLGDLVDRLTVRPGGPVAVGSGAEVADRIQEWLDATDSDGLNLWHAITPGTYADFAEYVVPELQSRGVYRTAYEPGRCARSCSPAARGCAWVTPPPGFVRSPVRAGRARRRCRAGSDVLHVRPRRMSAVR